MKIPAPSNPARFSRRLARPLSASCAALVTLSTASLAATDFWLGSTDALWDTATNWDLAGVAAKPTIADDVLFPTPVPATGGTITLGAGETALSLTFRDNYTLTGGDLTLGTGGA